METVMTEDVNTPYKLDFYYQKDFAFETKKYNLETVSSFSAYWGRATDSFLRNVAREYAESGRAAEFWAYADIDESIKKYTYNFNDEQIAEIKHLVREAFKDPEYLTNYQKYAELRWDVQRIFDKAGEDAGKNTPEYKMVLTAFDEWAKTRPGVVEAFNKFIEKSRKSNPDIDRKFCLEDLADLKRHTMFRQMLETSRPIKFKPGMVVKLKDEYINKKRKDPFRYAYDHRDSPRVGVVCENKKTTFNNNIGMGSRGVTIMWFATGEETMLPERCLNITEL